MNALNYVVGVIFILICAVLVVLVLLQEGKSQGLGAIQGSVENTYWSKNKGRSSEGMMKKLTVVLAILFILLSVFLDMNII
ncbi:preprotein translocase subunit SecG [Butyrivibrio sp. M55]|uniref:preprotein translocase subunit SecG n=1 Tax=Butyrivibrio sp. M55 TaxID=1855323 RepID=UPI0008DF9D03|nr:preprotein translocase subunit SecG [Butyrivibrio sp. M55]SFU38123.1 preprotein translocase subunit SecG [Butyrivibrio sp. M55]